MAALALAVILLVVALARGPDAPGRPAPAYTPPPARATQAASPAPPAAPAASPTPAPALATAARPPAGATAIGELRLSAAGVRVDAQVVRFAPPR
jgi:hypothetical protein